MWIIKEDNRYLILMQSYNPSQNLYMNNVWFCDPLTSIENLAWFLKYGYHPILHSDVLGGVQEVKAEKIKCKSIIQDHLSSSFKAP